MSLKKILKNKYYMMQLLLAIILTIILNIPASATIIRGQNKKYAGKELTFYKYSDPVSREKIYILSLKVDGEGNFMAETDITNSTCLYCDFGIYRGMLILEPKKTIDLLLPPLREKSFTEMKNPYFEPVEFWFITSTGDHLNDRISEYDVELNKLTDINLTELYLNQSKDTFDSLAFNLNNFFDYGSSAILKVHNELKLKSVEYDVFRLSPAKVSETFNSVNPAYWELPAFTEFFDKTFANRLSLELGVVNNKDIKQAAFNANTKFFINLTESKYLLREPASCLALLKMFHDAFYSGDVPEQAIIKMISSGFFSKNKDNRIRTVSANILKKLKYLSPGTAAPVICLKNTDGERICSDKKTDKYKYLVFADTEMIICREQLKYLQKIEESFSKHMEIIIVIKKSDLIEMKIFLDRHKIPGIHMIDENNEFSQVYRIKSFPQCFLLDQKHQIVLKQTKAPLDGFEQQFAALLQKKLSEERKN
jgi:peroxiredoxin